ncbi:MAG: hypothetical protein M3T96_05135, partial [Acidobacteriota bacterium]|nr:hypothetical protein [Acidobacteriota bacterium]
MKFRLPEIPPPKLINTLRSYNLLPAIVFMPTRRRCDEAATEVALDKSQKNDAEKREQRQEIYLEFLELFPEIKTHKHRKILVDGGIAAHHAGHIPAWKLLVERMMSGGLLNAIFATSTVAAGVDFPARTVVILNADARGNDGWRSLQASELQQMTGRAGRRGKDNVGFVIVAPSNFQNPPKIAELLKSPPNALESKFRATYTSLLNLLDAFGEFKSVRDIAEKSFAFRDTVRTVSKLESNIEQRRQSLRKKLKESEFDYTLNDIRGFERLTQARLRLEALSGNTRGETRRKWLEETVEAGRIVTKSRNSKRIFLVLSVFGEKVATMREDGQGVTLSLSHIGRVYADKYPIKESSLDKAFDDIVEGRNTSLIEPKSSPIKTERDDAIEIINRLIEQLMPANANEEQQRSATGFLWECWDDAEFIEKTNRDIDYLKGEIWLPFEHRAKVLDHFGYLDFRSQKVTERGKWLADLRVDRPLLVGEVLRHGVFDSLATKQIAGLMAAMAADADRNYGELYLSDALLETLTKVEDIIFKVSDVEWKNGIEPAPEMNFSAAAAAERWADGMAWSDLVFNTKAEEGDLVRLLSRTGEALMQIAHQKDANPEAATLA